MFSFLSKQIYTILIVLGLVLLVLFVSSVLFYVARYLSSRELSDQLGWLNFKKPTIGVAFFMIGFLSVILLLLLFLIVII